MEELTAIVQLIAFNYRNETLGVLIVLLLLLLLLRFRSRKIAQKAETARVDRSEEKRVIDEDDDLREQADIVFEEEISEDLGIEEQPEIEEAVYKEAYAVEEEIEEKPKAAISLFDRLKTGLTKTRQSLSQKFDGILSSNRKIDDEVLEEIEEILITSDVGVPTTMELIDRMSKKASDIKTADDFKSHLKMEMLSFVDDPPTQQITKKPHVIMMVGVNGVGKTTTIGKLAAKYSTQGKKVLLAASDTFRAAAVEQLQIWADRSGAELIRHRDKADPAAVAFDSVEAAIARGTDIVIVDTAGRLQTKVNLMEQLKKIKRSIAKKLMDAPHEVLLVLDATTGQNAVSQAKLFHEGIGITGIILTKLDGTAKGGIVLSICHTLNLPIYYIGIGEGIDDLQEFDPKMFIDALL